MKKLDKLEIACGHVVHCPTLTEATKLCAFLRDNNFRWRSGDTYEITRWNECKEEMCYNPYSGSYSKLEYYKNKGKEDIEYQYDIISVDEFINLF